MNGPHELGSASWRRSLDGLSATTEIGDAALAIRVEFAGRAAPSKGAGLGVATERSNAPDEPGKAAGGVVDGFGGCLDDGAGVGTKVFVNSRRVS